MINEETTVAGRMQVATGPTAVSVKALQKELRLIQEEGVEGFTVKLANENNLFEWEVVIFGPPQTLYEGGYFKVRRTHSTTKNIA